MWPEYNVEFECKQERLNHIWPVHISLWVCECVNIIISFGAVIFSAIEQRTVDCLVDNEWEEMWVGVTELVVLSSEFLSVTEEYKE
jgi:hypothetical protein